MSAITTHSPALSCKQVTVTTTSQVVEIVNGDWYKKVRIINTSSSPIHYRAGDNTAVAVAFAAGVGDPIVAAGTSEDIWIGEDTHVAVVVGTGTAQIEIQPIQYKQ